MTRDLEILLEAFPPESRAIIRETWGALPADVRRELSLTLGGIVKLLRRDSKSAHDLLEIMSRMAGPALTPLTSVAILGPVNAGKSTLYNRLVTDKTQKAEVSPVPGTTKVNQQADLGLFSLVDTPGADHGAEVGEQERNNAYRAARDADFLLILLDASRGVTRSDKELYDDLRSLGKPFLVVLNKVDLVTKAARQRVKESAASTLGLEPDSIVAISAQTSRGVEKLILEMAATEPRLLGRLGQMLEPFRRKLAWQCIRRSVIGASLIALTPIPFMDLIPLTALQGSMVLTLARIYDKEMNWRRAKELLTTFGAGWLFRTLFQELSKLAGLPGWALSASIAGSATLVMGLATMRWFESGKRPSSEELKKLGRDSQSKLAKALGSLGKGKPTKKHLTEELDKVLPSITEELDDTLPETKGEAGNEEPQEPGGDSGDSGGGRGDGDLPSEEQSAQ